MDTIIIIGICVFLYLLISLLIYLFLKYYRNRKNRKKFNSNI